MIWYTPMRRPARTRAGGRATWIQSGLFQESGSGFLVRGEKGSTSRPQFEIVAALAIEEGLSVRSLPEQSPDPATASRVAAFRVHAGASPVMAR